MGWDRAYGRRIYNLTTTIFGNRFSNLNYREAIHQTALTKKEQEKTEEQREKAVKLSEKLSAALIHVRNEKAKTDKELAKAEFVACAFRLRDAQASIQRGQLDAAAATLAVCDSDLRGWEHDYLLRQTQLEVWRGTHSTEVHSVAFSSNGDSIATVSNDMTVKVWDTDTGKELLSFPKHPGGAMSVAFSPDGKRMVSGGWNGRVKVWDTELNK